MDTFAFHDKNGKSIFHFLYQSYFDLEGTHKRILFTALPDELIREVDPDVYNLFKNQNRHIDNNIVEIAQQLGTKIIRHKNAHLFYYTNSLLSDREMFEHTFHKVIDIRNNFYPKPGVIYSESLYPVEHYIIQLKIHRYRIFYPLKFKEEINEVPPEMLGKYIPTSIIQNIFDIICDKTVRFFIINSNDDVPGVFALKYDELKFFYRDIL